MDALIPENREQIDLASDFALMIKRLLLLNGFCHKQDKCTELYWRLWIINPSGMKNISSPLGGGGGHSGRPPWRVHDDQAWNG